MDRKDGTLAAMSEREEWSAAGAGPTAPNAA